MASCSPFMAKTGSGSSSASSRSPTSRLLSFRERVRGSLSSALHSVAQHMASRRGQGASGQRTACGGPPSRDFVDALAVRRLEGMLAIDEADVSELEEESESLPLAGSPCSPTSGTAAWPPELREFHARCLSLSRRLEDLAADALEAACRGAGAPGMAAAMEVFNRASADLERLADCLQACRAAASGAACEPPSTRSLA